MGAEGLCTLQGAGALNLQGFEGLTEAAAPDEAPQALNPALPSVSFEWETVRCELINRIQLPNLTKPNNLVCIVPSFDWETVGLHTYEKKLLQIFSKIILRLR